jgi:hypothetical protein
MKKKILLACLIAFCASPALAQNNISTPTGFSFDIFEWISSLFDGQEDEDNEIIKSDGVIYDAVVKSDGTVYDAIIKSDGIIYD